MVVCEWYFIVVTLLLISHVFLHLLLGNANFRTFPPPPEITTFYANDYIFDIEWCQSHSVLCEWEQIRYRIMAISFTSKCHLYLWMANKLRSTESHVTNSRINNKEAEFSRTTLSALRKKNCCYYYCCSCNFDSCYCFFHLSFYISVKQCIFWGVIFSLKYAGECD